MKSYNLITCAEMLDVIKAVFGADASTVRERRHDYVVQATVECIPLRVYVSKSNPRVWRVYDPTGDGLDGFAWYTMLQAKYAIIDELDRHYC